jgi:hypothetical protein
VEILEVTTGASSSTDVEILEVTTGASSSTGTSLAT